MAVGTIVGIIILVIILYLVLSWWSNSYVYLSGLNNGKKEIKIPAKKLSKGAERASNFSYSIWFYINDWNYRFGEKKIIFERGSKHHLCPEVSLDKFENNLKIKLAIYNHSESNAENFFFCIPQYASGSTRRTLYKRLFRLIILLISTLSIFA